MNSFIAALLFLNVPSERCNKILTVSAAIREADFVAKNLSGYVTLEGLPKNKDYYFFKVGGHIFY